MNELVFSQKLLELFSWSKLDFFYPTEEMKREALVTEQFIPENNLPVGLEVWNNKLFITIPRWKPGIPATLNYVPLDVTLRAKIKSPMLIPYPNLEENELGNCTNGLTTVYRIKVDSCDRLWVLDTGTYGYDNTTINVCPYSINVFDLKMNKIIRKYTLKTDDTNERTFIANIAVDIGKNCEDTFAYFSDELGYGLIVYSWEANDSWRFTHSYFLPDPLAGDFNIAGLNFQWGFEGIFGITLSQKKADGYRTLFFHPLASNQEFAVSTQILRNKNRVSDSFHEFVPLTSRGPNSHVTTSVIDNNGIMFYNLIDRNSIGCWNSKYPYHPSYQTIVERDDTKLIFPCDIKAVGDYLWVMSDKMPVFLESTLNYTDINFRILFAPINKLIEHSICQNH